MAKFKRGIPADFRLDVEPVRDLGDYLDEPGPKPAAPKGQKEPLPAPMSPATALPPSRHVASAVPPVVPPSSPAAAADFQPVPPTFRVASSSSSEESLPRQEAGGRPKAPRREISMTPDTLRMSDELLDFIRGGSGQRDTKANELFHALVLLAYEARGELDVHTIPKRGQWGTPTARAYPLELKNAFLRALLKKYSGVSESPTGLRYPVNSAA